MSDPFKIQDRSSNTLCLVSLTVKSIQIIEKYIAHKNLSIGQQNSMKCALHARVHTPDGSACMYDAVQCTARCTDTRVSRHVEHALSPIQSFRPLIRTDRRHYLSGIFKPITLRESSESYNRELFVNQK